MKNSILIKTLVVSCLCLLSGFSVLAETYEVGSGTITASATAAGLMEKLLTDSDPQVPANAAIALYRISGRKVPQFPQGYGE